MKLLEVSIRENLDDTGYSNYILDTTPKAQFMKEINSYTGLH